MSRRVLISSGVASTVNLAATSLVTAHASADETPISIGIALPKLDTSTGPIFSPEEVKVVFVLGGPGVGKGTQCNRLVSQYGDYVHLSAGDLLREERHRTGSQYGELIEHHIREGKIVPYEITISLLRKAMEAHFPKQHFLIDGFPRNVEQGKAFEAAICPCDRVLFFECSEEEMLKRLMHRGQNSGRSDDNIESIMKRFRTFKDATMPVWHYYNAKKKLLPINAVGSVEQVYDRAEKALLEKTKKTAAL